MTTSEKTKETKEVHKTEFVDKQKAKVLYEYYTRDKYDLEMSGRIEVFDDTSEAAYKTFEKVMDKTLPSPDAPAEEEFKVVENRRASKAVEVE